VRPSSNPRTTKKKKKIKGLSECFFQSELKAGKTHKKYKGYQNVIYLVL
jgi:hypothetical protein